MVIHSSDPCLINSDLSSLDQVIPSHFHFQSRYQPYASVLVLLGPWVISEHPQLEVKAVRVEHRGSTLIEVAWGFSKAEEQSEELALESDSEQVSGTV